MALAVAVCGFAGVARAQTCGPMDVVFVVDTTGSMGGAIESVKSELPVIIEQIQTASGGDFRLGLIDFNDDVIVLNDLAGGNLDAVKTNIGKLSAGGGGSIPEASDEGVKTALRGLKASDRAAGQQTGDFNGRFREEATKIIILITDAPPAGFDDAYVVGDDDVAVRALASEAGSKGIHISAVYVPTGGDTSDEALEIIGIMRTWATLSTGFYVKVESDGSGTGEAIREIIAGCGGGVRALGSSLQVNPHELALENGESADVVLTNYIPDDTKTLVYANGELPPDTTVTFTRIAKPEVEGTDQQRVRINVGPQTPAGEYIIDLTATHTDTTAVQRDYVLLIVGCRPPHILGTNQPSTVTADTTGRGTIGVTASGSTGFRYQWYQGYSGNTLFPVAGATGASLNAQPGEYWVRVSNACGSVDSRSGTINPR